MYNPATDLGNNHHLHVHVPSSSNSHLLKKKLKSNDHSEIWKEKASGKVFRLGQTWQRCSIKRKNKCLKIFAKRWKLKMKISKGKGNGKLWIGMGYKSFSLWIIFSNFVWLAAISWKIDFFLIWLSSFSIGYCFIS